MSPQDWNRIVLAHAPASGAFLQSHEWGEFQRALGREVRRFERPDAVAQAVARPLPGGFFGWELHRAAADETFLGEISRDLRETPGISFHVEPATAVALAGSRPAASRQPQHTTILDLNQPEETLLAAMHHKTRYNIRLAAKHGVVVERQSPENGARMLDEFTRLLAETAARDKFQLHTTEHYRKMVEVLAEPQPVVPGAHPPHVLLFTARHEDEPLASVLMMFFGDTVTYLHGASSDRKRELMAPHLLHWEIIRRAKERGYRSYDFWGVAPEDAPASHPWTGITRFKLGFGGTRVAMPGAWELPLRPQWYRLYRLANRLRGK